MLTKTTLSAIKLYQRFISPYKGFCCAYRVHTGRAGCSQFGYRAISRYGVFDGIAVLKRRLQLCGQVYHQCAQKVSHAAFSVMLKLPNRPNSQRGDCDPGISADCLPDIDVCDVFSSKKDLSFLQFCDCGSCGSCGTDKPKGHSQKVRRKQRRQFSSE